MTVHELVATMIRARLSGLPLIRGRPNAPQRAKPFAEYNIRHLTPSSHPDKLPVDANGVQRHVYQSILHADLKCTGPGSFGAMVGFVSRGSQRPHRIGDADMSLSISRIGTVQDLTGLVPGTDQNEEKAFVEMSFILTHTALIEIGLIEHVVIEGKTFNNAEPLLPYDQAPSGPEHDMDGLGTIPPMAN